MPKHELLSEIEREHLLGIPVDRDELARLYTLEPKDIDLIRRRPGDRNHLGAALQLAVLRHPGMTLAQVLHRSRGVPDELVSFIAEQLDLPAKALADYASRKQTMTDHARELATILGLRSATRADVSFMGSAQDQQILFQPLRGNRKHNQMAWLITSAGKRWRTEREGHVEVIPRICQHPVFPTLVGPE